MDVDQNDGDWVEGLANGIGVTVVVVGFGSSSRIERERERERERWNMKYYYLRNLVLFLWDCRFIKKQKNNIYIYIYKSLCGFFCHLSANMDT